MDAEQTIQLATWRRGLYDQIRKILNQVKKELEKASLEVQRESLIDAKLRIQEARELTKKLLDQHIDDWLDKKLTQMLALIADIEDLLAPQEQGGGGAARPSANLLAFEERKPLNQTEADDMESTGETVHEREVALAVEDEAASAEPREVGCSCIISFRSRSPSPRYSKLSQGRQEGFVGLQLHP